MRSRWSRARLPRDVRATWVESLTDSPHRPARVLAWAPTPEGFCVGSPAALSLGDSAGWQHVGWHEIAHGGWDAATRRLSWTTYGDETASVELAGGRLPELFRERIAASIAVEKYVPWRGSQGITVSGRRDLGDPAASLHWHVTLSPGLTTRTPGVAEAAPPRSPRCGWSTTSPDRLVP